MAHHPNFPPSLSIAPNTPIEHAEKDAFGVEAQREAISRYGIAGRVWEAAHALCAYVDPSPTREFDPPFADTRAPGVLELGSGTGVVAARVARAIRGGFVIATDLPEVCPLLTRNLGDAVCVRPLAWGDRAHAAAIARELGARRVTHVVCSDLVYFPELFGPLLRTLVHLTEEGPPVQIVMSYKIRSLTKEAPFWSAFGLWFSFQPVLVRRRVQSIESSSGPRDERPEPWKQFGADDGADRIFVFVAHRRPESIAWTVPESDSDLIGGVGARNTTAKKEDDTFETILFMSMDIDDSTE